MTCSLGATLSHNALQHEGETSNFSCGDVAKALCHIAIRVADRVVSNEDSSSVRMIVLTKVSKVLIQQSLSARTCHLLIQVSLLDTEMAAP